MTRTRTIRFFAWLSTLVLLAMAGCGGGGGGGGTGSGTRPFNPNNVSAPSIPGANVLAVRVDRGVDGNAFNSPFVTVTLCQPGTGTCVEVDRVLVDTGSNGLRIAASAVGSLALAPVTTPGGNPVGECARFASGYTWGAVRRADVKLGGLTAANLPVQVIADAALPNVPAACSGSNLGATASIKGILGVGLFEQDCGTTCQNDERPAVYFSCSGAGCTSTRLATTSQVTNPVSALPFAENNGVVLVLPPVPAGGAATVTGSLILGVGTQANNQLGSAIAMTTDAQGFFTTIYKGVTYAKSFIDSGSNGLFFDDPSIAACEDFYCPASPLALSATQVSTSGVSRTVDFTVESITGLADDTAAAHVGGPPGPLTQAFDWGLPFFFGRSVFVAIEGRPTPAGPGPFWAW